MMAVYALLVSRSIATLCRARMTTAGCAAAEASLIVLLVAAKRPRSNLRLEPNIMSAVPVDED